MFGVVTYIENGNFENEWDYVLSNIKPDKLYLIDCGYVPTNNRMRDLPLYENWDSLPNVPIILLAPDTMRNFSPTVSILDFEHPKDALYIFGPNNLHIGEEATRKPDYIVSIPTDTKDEMFNYGAYLITAWSRRYG